MMAQIFTQLSPQVRYTIGRGEGVEKTITHRIRRTGGTFTQHNVKNA
jgi:hypothetical protein